MGDALAKPRSVAMLVSFNQASISIMKNLCKILTIAGFMAVSVGAMAANWTIKQSATITTATPELKQGDTARVTASTQAINGIALESTADNVASGSSQLARLPASTSFTLTQGPLVSGAKQAINHIEAQIVGIGTVVRKVTQTLTSPSTAITLGQTVGAGGGASNLQAMNAVEVAKTVGGAEQNITESGSLTLKQDSVTTANNTQAVNYAAGATVGNHPGSLVTQSITVTGATNFNQAATGGANVQGGNIARSTGPVTTGSDVVYANQIFSGAALDLTQDMLTGGGNTQAVNYVESTADAGAEIRNIRQSITVSGVTEFSSAPASTNNIQAGNLTRSAKHIIFSSQEFKASSASALTFGQTAAGDNNIQAGNMATLEVGDVTSRVTLPTQTFTGSATANTFTQNPTGDNSTQAANLLDLGTGGILPLASGDGPQQVYTATGSVTMTQSAGNSQLQALNATLDKTGGIKVVSIRQSVSAGGALTMAQQGVTDSGQFANFAGLAY